MTKNASKRAFLMSTIALILCMSMLVGTTFAWFTDSASTSVNMIQAGTLDVALEMLNDEGKWVNAEGETLSFIKADGSEQILWEPGCTYKLPTLRIVNKGDLWLSYQLVITGIDGDAKLNEAIEWTFSGAKGQAALAPLQATQGIIIEGHMKEEAGNEYQGLTIDGISITVMATQYTYEYDSFTNQYDANATNVSQWDGTIDAEGLAANTNESKKVVEIKTAAQLAAFAAAVNAGNNYKGYTVNLMTPVNLNNIDWAPIGATNGETLDSYPSYTFSGTFNGNGLPIFNLKVESKGTNAVAGLFGSANRATIENVVIDGADIKSEHYAAGILAYDTEYTNVIGCTVKNATITSSTNGTHDNGDKAGGIVGAMTGANAAYAVSGNTVENVIITAYRDAGGIIGMAATGLKVEENTAKNVIVLQDNSDDYKNAPQTTFGAIVGRGEPALKNNTEIDCTVALGNQVTTAGNAEELNAALENADVTVINLGSGDFAMNGANSINPAEGKTIIGNGETTLDSINGFKNCTFKNVTINDIYTIENNTLIDCEIVAPVDAVAKATQVRGDTKFIGCSFTANGEGTSFWADGVEENATVVFENCTFTDNIRLGGSEEKGNAYTFSNCEFKGGAVNWSKALVITYTAATFENCTFNVEAPALYGIRLAVGMTADDITLINTNTNIMVP